MGSSWSRDVWHREAVFTFPADQLTLLIKPKCSENLAMKASRSEQDLQLHGLFLTSGYFMHSQLEGCTAVTHTHRMSNTIIFNYVQ